MTLRLEYTEELVDKSWYYAKRKPRKCPKCGNNGVATIRFGLPIYNEKTRKDMEEGKIILGGCCLMIGGPVWQCLKCKAELCRQTKEIDDDLPF